MSTKKPATPPKCELAGTDTLDRGNTNAKLQALEEFRSDATGQALRTNQGVKISDNQNTLKVGARGPSLLEDFVLGHVVVMHAAVRHAAVPALARIAGRAPP